MEIEVRSRDAEVTPLIRELATIKLQLTLARFHDRIATVKIGFVDENGPRGGVDKTCRVIVRGREAWAVMVSEQDADPYTAIGRAGDRIGQVVAREIKRQRRHEKARIAS